MLQPIAGPDTVLAFRAVGTIEKRDDEAVLEPAVHEMTERLGELRFVDVLGDDFDGDEVDAAIAWPAG